VYSCAEQVLFLYPRSGKLDSFLRSGSKVYEDAI